MQPLPAVPALPHRERAVNEGPLAARFRALWQACGGADCDRVWEGLQLHYRQPHRHYHTLGHVAHCLRELDNAGALIEAPRAVEVAIWFHDVIYHYGAQDNEIRSAAYFRQFAAPAMPAPFVERVCQLVLATQHAAPAPDRATAFVVDIDLSGFGLPWTGYLADSAALRREAQGVSDARYYRGKLLFLGELQRRPSLFQTPFFRERLEAAAQRNIARFAAQLRAQGFGDPEPAQTHPDSGCS